MTNINDWLQTYRFLIQCGALTVDMNDGVFDQNDGQLTLIGEIATCLNMDARQAKLIAMGHVYDHLQDAIIMGML